MSRRAGNKLTDLNWEYLKDAITDEGYTLVEVSEAIGLSKGVLAKSIRENRLMEQDLQAIRELVHIDMGKLVPRSEPKKAPEPKKPKRMVTIDEAIEDMRKDKAEKLPEGGWQEEIESLKATLSRIEQNVNDMVRALNRAGFMQGSYEERAKDILYRMLDRKGKCTKADFIKEVVMVKIPQEYIDKAIEASGCIVAVSRSGKETTTWLIKE